MSETLTETPAGTPESPPPGGNWEQVTPNPVGSEVGAGGTPTSDVEGGGPSPGLATVPPAQQAQTPPAAPEQAPVPGQQAAETTQQPIPAKEDESRFEYWQSKSGQIQRELDEIKGGQLHAIAQYVQRTPEMLDIVEEGLRGGPITKPRSMPEKPIRPQKPDNYDSSEAHDPETASGRYTIAQNEYLEKKDIYIDARDEQATIQVKRNADKARLAELKTGLMREGGLNEVETDEFLNMLDSPEARNPVTLAKYYRVLKAPAQDDIANQEKARQLLAQRKGLESPPPLATAGGETPPQMTPEQQMVESMKAHQSTSLRGRLR